MHAVLGGKTGTTFVQGKVKVINFLQLSKRNHINVYSFSPQVAYPTDAILCHANPKCLKMKFKSTEIH